MFKWLKDYRTRSVTELEMLHGFLLNGYQSANHSFFLFREESYLAQKDDATRKKYISLLYLHTIYILI